jgi:glycine cleavage system aminomethyltransferase T
MQMRGPRCMLIVLKISIPPNKTVEVAKLLSQPPVQLTGLGARDSLRLEAGMCLYGQDLDESTTPVEAGLTWVIGAWYIAFLSLRDDSPLYR